MEDFKIIINEESNEKLDETFKLLKNKDKEVRLLAKQLLINSKYY